MNFDLTKEGLNTLSDEATDVAKEIVNETTIYIIGSEDAIRGDEVYSNYSLKYSQVANLADRLHELNDKIKVEYIDPDMNPQFISDYADDSLTTGATRRSPLPTCSASSRILPPASITTTPR